MMFKFIMYCSQVYLKSFYPSKNKTMFIYLTLDELSFSNLKFPNFYVTHTYSIKNNQKVHSKHSSIKNNDVTII